MSSNKKSDKKNEENKDFEFLDQTLRPSRWNEYIGQENIKKNLQILLNAAKEREHPPEHLLFYGPPGTGKTMLASRLPGILPSLSEREMLDVAAIYSVAAQDYPWRTRPFRAPHHTASAIALVGGGCDL